MTNREHGELVERYRDIFAEITAKAQPRCDDPSDPEKITGYWLPVGPLHRAAGKLDFQMFGGEAHLERAVAEIESLSLRMRRMEEALDDLQVAEAEYRLMHDRHGDGSQAAGRAWDLMRRAGDKARAALTQ